MVKAIMDVNNITGYDDSNNNKQQKKEVDSSTKRWGEIGQELELTDKRERDRN